MSRAFLKRLLAALVLCLVALSVGPPARAQDLNAYAQEVFRLVNDERARAGLRHLVRAPELDRAAQKYSQYMADAGFFSHTGLDGSTPWDRMRREGYNFSWAGENIAYGYRTPQEVMVGWMNSPGHAANILNATFTEIGIGVAVPTGAGHPIYWTQNFAHRPGGPPPPPPGSTVTNPPPGGRSGDSVARPALTAITPGSGRPGDSVSLTGSGFANPGTVTFVGADPVSARVPARVIFWSVGQVVVEVPVGAETGDVYLQTTAGTSNGIRFEVLPSTPPPQDMGTIPRIDAITPGAARPSTIVSLVGRNFTSFRGSVTLNGAPILGILAWTESRIDLLIPFGSTSGPVVVTAVTGSSPAFPFTVIGAP